MIVNEVEVDGEGRKRIEDDEKPLYLGFHASLGVLRQEKASSEGAPSAVISRKILSLRQRINYDCSSTLYSRSTANERRSMEELPLCLLCIGRNERSHIPTYAYWRTTTEERNCYRSHGSSINI